jgi:hypothetical protein
MSARAKVDIFLAFRTDLSFERDTHFEEIGFFFFTISRFMFASECRCLIKFVLSIRVLSIYVLIYFNERMAQWSRDTFVMYFHES